LLLTKICYVAQNKRNVGTKAMVRETRYLLVGNLPDKVTEDVISEQFQR